MNYQLIKLHKRASLESIFLTNPDGIIEEFIYKDSPKSRLDIQTNLAHNISLHINGGVYLDVKYKYGSRETIFDLVFRHNNYIYIGKFSKAKKFDAVAFELDLILDDIKENYLERFKINIVGLIVLESSISKSAEKNLCEIISNKIEFIQKEHLKEGKI